jgi:hypothetical protein
VVSSLGAVGLISSKTKTLAQLQVFLRRERKNLMPDLHPSRIHFVL